MNPLKISATNYRTFERLDLDLPAGCLAIVGDNGAGKSSIVNVIDLALFGPETRSLGDYLTDDASTDSLEIELAFEHAGDFYRVRRGFSARGRGKTTLDLEVFVGPADDFDAVDASWEPLTRESQKETQAAIEELLGLSRETFRASAFLAQGDGAAFTEAQPRDRKRILSQVIGLSVWDRLHEAASSDRRHTERLVGELAGRIALLEETGRDLTGLEASCSRLRSLVSDLEREHADATASLDAAAVAVQELERAEATYRQRKAEYAEAKMRLDAHAQIEEDAIEATSLAAVVRDELETLPTQLQMQAAELELTEIREGAEAQLAERNAYDAKKAEYEAALLRRNDLLARASEKNELAIAGRQAADTALSHVGEARCDLCEQILGAEAADAYAKRLREQAATDDFTAAELDREAAAIALPELGPEPVTDPTLASRYQAAMAANERVRAQFMQRPRLEERLAGYDATIAKAKTPEYRAALEVLKAAARAAAGALDEIEEPEPGGLEECRAAALAARGRLAEVVARLTQTQTELIVANERLEAAEKVEAEREAAMLKRGELQDELELLALLERAYGRDGIPALIVEASAIPAIETEANRLLAELGTSYRVELRTQRALKSGDGLADTLDVVVIAEAGERAYETFSGGERTRINLALRIALARLLAHRRGAESRLLAIDEPEFLDEAGTTQLALVLRDLTEEFDRIVLVSHMPSLRDAFDNVISIEKTDGRSRVAA
jgi:DNA repair protein SbcC/Rad50